MAEEETEVYAIIHIKGKEWRINMKRKGPEDPFRTGSIGYSGQDNIFVFADSGENKKHSCNINIVEHGTKGKYQPRSRSR